MPKVSELPTIPIAANASFVGYGTAIGRYTVSSLLSYIAVNGQAGPAGPPGAPGAGSGITLPISQADVTGLPAALTARILTSARGASNGIAPLDADMKVPAANLPASSGSGVTLPISQADVTGLPAALTARVLTSARGAANGVAPLDADMKVPAANLPASSGGGVTLPIQITDVTNLATTLTSKEVKTNKGVSNGYCPLDLNGKVAAQYLPSASSGAITMDSKVPIVALTNTTALNQANNNRIFVYSGTSILSVNFEMCEVGTSFRFVQASTGAIWFFGGWNQEIQAEEQLISLGGYTSTVGPGASVMAVKINTTTWHLSGALG